MSRLLHVAAALACTFVLSVPAAAQHKPAPARPAPSKAAPVKPAPAAEKGAKDNKPDVFVVAHVGDRFEVLAKSAVDARKQALVDEHKAQMTAYEKEKKAALAAKHPFTTPAPKALTLEVLPGEHATHAEADAAMARATEHANKPKEHDGANDKPGHDKPGHDKPGHDKPTPPAPRKKG